MKVVQEKFEHHYPLKPEADHSWATAASARTRKGLQTRHESGKYESFGSGLNRLPPGMVIESQEVCDINPMRTVTAGTDDVTDNPQGKDFVKGYVPLRLRPTDDMWTSEHEDAFYSEVTVDGVTGFLEKNNVLDRS